MTRHIARFRTAIAVVCLIAGMAVTAGAQKTKAQAHTPPASVATPVAIALAGTSQYGGGDVLIVRRALAEPHDVILVSQGATGQRLAEAVATAQGMRRTMGEVPSRDAVIRVSASGVKQKREGNAAVWLEDLQGQEPTDLPGLGRVRWMTLFLPNGSGKPVKVGK